MHYLTLTILANPGESESAFRGRLTAFWTHMLRTHPDDYERVYSEAVEFEEERGRISRQYMIEPEVAGMLAGELNAKGFESLPIDEDDEYSKAEASSSDWFQIEH
jgi:hypothetical protein